MEKQISFSIKPIRFLALSFTISSSVIFLIFFSTWVFKITPSQTHNLGFSNISLDSSDFVLKNSIFNGRDEKDSSQTGDFSSFAGPQKRESETTVATDAKSKENLLTAGNSSLTPFGKNLSVNSVSASCSGKSGFDIESHVTIERPNISIRNRFNEENCDIRKGKWVFDESYPLYTSITCPFIDEGFNCQSNGRLDKGYMKWRWQPQDCDIPRFNATKMLDFIRGKRLVFIGDSINRNQWESMVCLLMGGVNDPRKVYEVRGRKITKEKGNYCFKFEDYKCTVEYYVSHFLVHESKARIGRKRKQTLRIDTIDKGSWRWRGADILVFNTAHWWSHRKTKAGGGLWNAGGHCKEAFRPINETFTSNYPEKNLIVEEIISRMRNPVTFLNITRLSDYRPDAHPSIYGRKSVNPGVQDCSHWCLPGVPDNWNELLYYHMQLKTEANFVN